MTHRSMLLQALRAIALALAVAGVAATARGESVTITTSKDNTMIESFVGPKSNGAGQHCFAGRTGQGAGADLRRALMAFDVAAAVPAGATITSVTLRLHMSKTVTGLQPAALHLLQSDWGEGASDAPGNEGAGADAEPGDATYDHTFFPDEFWDTPGGDYAAATSATLNIGSIGFYSFSTAPMTDQVQSWLDDPASNFGWILRGNESTGVTAKRYDTRENPEPDFRPALTIEFETTGDCPADLDGDGQVAVTDLLTVLGDWDCTGDCAGDTDGDGVVDVSDLLAVLGAWGPC